VRYLQTPVDSYLKRRIAETKIGTHSIPLEYESEKEEQWLVQVTRSSIAWARMTTKPATREGRGFLSE